MCLNKQYGEGKEVENKKNKQKTIKSQIERLNDANKSFVYLTILHLLEQQKKG